MEVQLRRLGPNSKIKILKVPKECRTKIWLAGRGTSCQIYTKSKYASRQHFSITYREQKYFISDLQSANGTFLNDEKLTEEKMLFFGNIISVGVPSEMQNSPDCIVYIFELHSGGYTADKRPSLSENKVLEVEKSFGNSEVAPELGNIENREVDAQSEHTNEQSVREYLDVDTSSNDNEKSDMNDTSSSDVVLIESFIGPKKHSTLSLNESKPAKIRKLGERETMATVIHEESQVKIEFNDQKNKTNTREISFKDEDVFAYEALTQVDESQMKAEPDFVNYSLTEELIEISDSECDWTPSIKPEDSKSSEEDDDDDIVVLETINKSNKLMKNDLPPVYCKLEDELTEVDKKWVERLLKLKKEEFVRGDEEKTERMECDERDENSMEIDEREIFNDSAESSTKANDLNLNPCVVKLSRLSTHDILDQITESGAGKLPRTEVPQKIIRKIVPKKSVSFDMVPQVRYFEVSFKPKLTDSEKGRKRFTRIIFNICNWNTHWLEECKRVSADKDPPDICEERLRKIPKKFSSHSNYMEAFIPAMLLHLWNKIRDKWVDSGDSGFRQTVSCDSSEDYHAENLSVYKCTGLVQSVDAHKQLIREGHLVLLRLHQVQTPQFANPASEKYSKKLGYLVFGFVENKTYERYHNQPLHQDLAERCGSIVGDLHIVRLIILVKKRPSFLIDKKKLIQLTVVHQISREIRMFRGICFLPHSPLCNAILEPTKSEFPLVEPPVKEDLIFKGPVDDVQSEMVRKLSHACFSKSSFLYSIHGAAGSGKGQVIFALILQLLYGDEWKCKRPKIIYCTQCSIPLDEMVIRLKNFRQTIEEPFNLVRVGPIKEVKSEVRGLCLSNLASSLRSLDQRVLEGKKFDAEIEVIKKADVICTTCISAGTPKMRAAFEELVLRDRNRKIICIIDEAMSCKETDSVVPLLLNVTHLLLVGDIYQLEPAFSGKVYLAEFKTYSVGLDMSLFWRIYKNFINIPQDLWPIYILKTQYRMNSDLSKFTSQLIYSTLLQKPAFSAVKTFKNIKSYLLFVDQTSENIVNGENENREVRIVSLLMKAVTKLAKATNKNVPFRFALITCDNKQTEKLQSLLPKRKFPEIEIDEIQAFQGREFDVVTFVYDGRKITTSWLATAFTRARYSLFIFASEMSIYGNSFFRKVASEAEKNNFLEVVHSDMTVKEFEQLVAAV